MSSQVVSTIALRWSSLSSVKTISRPVIDRLPINQLDQFACRQLDKVCALFLAVTSLIALILSWTNIAVHPPAPPNGPLCRFAIDAVPPVSDPGFVNLKSWESDDDMIRAPNFQETPMKDSQGEMFQVGLKMQVLAVCLIEFVANIFFKVCYKPYRRPNSYPERLHR
jgi:hypothetical protein